MTYYVKEKHVARKVCAIASFSNLTVVANALNKHWNGQEIS